MKGDAHAQHKIGEMYESGRGVKRDSVTAYAWYNIAAYFEYAAAKRERESVVEYWGTFLNLTALREQKREAQKLSKQLLGKIEGKVTGKPPVDYEKMPAPRIDPETGLPIAKWFKPKLPEEKLGGKIELLPSKPKK